jgi:hypothetical protein
MERASQQKPKDKTTLSFVNVFKNFFGKKNYFERIFFALDKIFKKSTSKTKLFVFMKMEIFYFVRAGEFESSAFPTSKGRSTN